MTTCERATRARASGSANGFTLVELTVVLAVIGILVGTAMPLASALVDAGRRQDVVEELGAIAEALDEHYFDHAAFPVSLTDAGFYGVYLQPGIGGTAVIDSWGGGDLEYRYQINSGPNTVSIWSRGEDGVDDGNTNEEFTVTVSGAAPGLRKTRMRMRVIIETLANYLESGATLTGTWSTDRAAMGLGTEFQVDGFGTAFSLSATTLVLRSAGPDRVINSSDDLTS